jgi:hypothetical protein
MCSLDSGERDGCPGELDGRRSDDYGRSSLDGETPAYKARPVRELPGVDQRHTGPRGLDVVLQAKGPDHVSSERRKTDSLAAAGRIQVWCRNWRSNTD